MSTEPRIYHDFVQIETNEHEFARLLRKLKAINNWQAVGTSNQWFAPDGRCVAVCLYDNAASTNTYHVRKDLV